MTEDYKEDKCIALASPDTFSSLQLNIPPLMWLELEQEYRSIESAQ